MPHTYTQEGNRPYRYYVCGSDLAPYPSLLVELVFDVLDSTKGKVDPARQLKELEKENARLKRILAEAELGKAILKEAAKGNW